MTGTAYVGVISYLGFPLLKPFSFSFFFTRIMLLCTASFGTSIGMVSTEESKDVSLRDGEQHLHVLNKPA